MNADTQQTYQAAERAYAGGDYKSATHLASELLKQLEAGERADDDQVRDAVLSWRAFVALLLGHIELHGRQRADQAANYYQLALDCQPQDTLADLAKQGLQRSKSARKETFNANVDEPHHSTPVQWRILHWIVAIDAASSLPHQHSPCINVCPKPINSHAMAHESQLPSTSQGDTST